MIAAANRLRRNIKISLYDQLYNTRRVHRFRSIEDCCNHVKPESHHDLHLNSIKETHMAPLTFWKGPGARGKDYKFIDRLVSEYMRIGSTELYIHKYLGPKETYGATPDEEDNLLNISDVVNMEIRSRKYDPDVYSLKGHYLVTDSEFDLKQFGLFLNTDTVFMTFHLNDMIHLLGRRLMSGDVIEVLHMRDDTTFTGRSISKFYVVEEGTRSAEGFSVTWWPHLWRIKCSPLTNSQEFEDILNRPEEDRGDGVPPPGANPDGSMPTVGDNSGRLEEDLANNDQVLAEAIANVGFRNYQVAHFYIMQDDLNKRIDVFNSDGIPPNQSKPVPSGYAFPAVYQEGDYFLRLDYMPPVLFQREPNRWKQKEINYRSEWLPAGRVLASFINNKDTTTLQDGTTTTVRQNLRTAVKPKFDPDIS